MGMIWKMENQWQIGGKTLRDRTNRKRFVSMIKYLSKEKDYTKLM